ncbi:chorismate synthase, partial [Phenoliferia sp. Uapishka_3]
MSTFGTLFRVTTYGESHCASVGAIIDGCPPGMPLTSGDLQPQLTRRRPGQSALTTPRNEADEVAIQSGTERGVTLGTPIGLMVRNKDQRPHDYTETDWYPRPSHADWAYLVKYDIKASSGGGRSSARETIGRVAAGAIAEKYLKLAYGVEIVSFVSSVGKIHMPTSKSENEEIDEEHLDFLNTITRETVDQNLIRCPDLGTASLMEQRIIAARDAGDSIGGTVSCVIRKCPVGLGEPVFDKLEAMLAHAMLSIPATKGFEIGSGFKGTELAGSDHNDAFVKKADGSLGTSTNRSGGVQGGISNGENIYFKVAFKSPATIAKAQPTAKYDGESGVLEAKGRHDPCVVPRAVPIVEAMAALVIMDAILIQNSRKASAALLPPLEVPLPPSMMMPTKEQMNTAGKTLTSSTPHSPATTPAALRLASIIMAPKGPAKAVAARPSKPRTSTKSKAKAQVADEGSEEEDIEDGADENDDPMSTLDMAAVLKAFTKRGANKTTAEGKAVEKELDTMLKAAQDNVSSIFETELAKCEQFIRSLKLDDSNIPGADERSIREELTKDLTETTNIIAHLDTFVDGIKPSGVAFYAEAVKELKKRPSRTKKAYKRISKTVRDEQAGRLELMQVRGVPHFRFDIVWGCAERPDLSFQLYNETGPEVVRGYKLAVLPQLSILPLPCPAALSPSCPAMKLSTTFLPILSTLALAPQALAAFPKAHRPRTIHPAAHQKLSRHVVEDATGTGLQVREADALHQLSKRGSTNARATYFAVSFVGLGACGITNSDSDFIVALNSAQYGDSGAISSYCFKEITISYGGKSTTAQITDECPGCPYGGLDMSPSLFQYFASESVGVIYVTWELAGSSDDAATTTSTTSKYTPTTTAWVDTSTTSVWTPDPTTSTTAWVQTTTSAWTPDPTTSTTSWTSITPTSTYVPPTTSSIYTTSSSPIYSSSTLSVNASSTAPLNITSSQTSPTSSSSSSDPTTAIAAPSEYTGGNLDGLNQLVIALGGLVGAAAQNAA